MHTNDYQEINKPSTVSSYIADLHMDKDKYFGFTPLQ